MREIHSHTAIRGIAALLVVVYHYMAVPGIGFDVSRYTSFFAKGYLWVDCFFILSGFILSYVYATSPGESVAGLSRFLRARFARIYPLHLATLLGLATWQIILPLISRHSGNVGTWSNFWLNAIGIQAWTMPSSFDWNFPSWSISVEFAAYLLFPLICVGLRYWPRITLAIVMTSVSFAIGSSRENWESIAVFRGLSLFGLGVVLFRFRDVFSTWATSGTQIAVLLGLIGCLHSGAPDWLADILFAALVGLTWLDGGIARYANARMLQALGDWSYSIYMLHIPVRIVSGYILADRVPPIAQFFTMLVITIGVGALSHRYFEMPARCYLNSLRRSERANLRVL